MLTNVPIIRTMNIMGDDNNRTSPFDRLVVRATDRALLARRTVLAPFLYYCKLYLVFSTTGGMARECSTFYRRLADMISIKQDKPYSLN